MQTILGSGGVIGKGIAENLKQYTDRIRLVSRNPKKVNENDELFPADLTNGEQVNKAVEGSEVVYLAAGLKYNLKVWQKEWPVIMNNVIHACKWFCAKLVFFDNVYSLGKVNGRMKEDTPMNPYSKKGEVRKQIAEVLLNEIEKGNLNAMIIRSADFYGPGASTSFANIMVLNNLVKGKKAQWLMNDSVKHSFTYTPDAAKAAAVLGNTESAYNQIWHAPTDKNALTGKEFITLAANSAGANPKYTVFKRGMLSLVGLFVPEIRESKEMLYQNEYEYLFDSSKFESKFFKATSYEQGIAETVSFMKNQNHI